jgi:glycosyltransferase involved in cell wall biosynthesis
MTSKDAEKMPRVVACMPAWQATSFIGPVLESVAAQTYPNIELLISVDACSDGTAEMCERFAETHPNVRVIRQTVRLGWIGNANFTLGAAQGDYAFFAFHDDPLEPTYVEKLVAALEANPQAVVAFSDFFTRNGLRTYDVLDGVPSKYERCRRIFHAYGAWWSPNRGLMRMGAVKKLGGMRHHLAGEYAADWPWLLRLAALGEFVHVPEPLLFKDLHERSLSKAWRSHLWNRFAVQLECIQALHEARLPLAQELYINVEALLFAIGLRSCPGWLKEIPRRVRAWISYRLAAG